MIVLFACTLLRPQTKNAQPGSGHGGQPIPPPAPLRWSAAVKDIQKYKLDVINIPSTND